MAATVRGSRTPRSSICAATISARACAGSGSRETSRTGRWQARASTAAAAAAKASIRASVRLREVHLAGGGLAAADARSRGRLTLDGDDAHRGLGLLLDGGLAGRVPAPARDQEPSPLGHDLLELVVARDPR